VTGNVEVDGSIANTTTGDVSIDSGIDLTGSIKNSLNGPNDPVQIDDDLDITGGIKNSTGDISFIDGVTIGGDLSITGATTINGPLTVTGPNSNLTIPTGGTLEILGSIKNSLGTGANPVKIDDALQVTGNLLVDEVSTLNGILEVYNSIKNPSTTRDSAVKIDDDILVTGDMAVNGNSSIDGNVEVTGLLTASSGISVDGGITLIGHETARDGIGSFYVTYSSWSTISGPVVDSKWQTKVVSCQGGEVLVSCGLEGGYGTRAVSLQGTILNSATNPTSCSVSAYNTATSDRSYRVYANCFDPLGGDIY